MTVCSKPVDSYAFLTIFDISQYLKFIKITIFCGHVMIFLRKQYYQLVHVAKYTYSAIFYRLFISHFVRPFLCFLNVLNRLDKKLVLVNVRNVPAYGGRSVCVYVNKKVIFNICAGVD